MPVVKGRQGRRVGGLPQTAPVGALATYFADYMVMPEQSVIAMALWVQAAHFIGEGDNKGPWDQFPILAVTSPEKRCGKSTLLDLLSYVTPRSEEGKFINPSPAAFYRAIEKCRPTIIMDESQSLKRRGSEASELLREMLNASTRRDECIVRCVGDDHEPTKFSIYSPKAFAQIGDPDGVLGDRCVPVRLERASGEQRTRFRLTEAQGRGNALRERLAEWATVNLERVEHLYGTLKPFGIRNDRMADMLTPLQAVAAVAGGLPVLEQYAKALDDRDRDTEKESHGVRLLIAIREIMGGKEFIPTDELIAELCKRSEEPWATYSYGRPINREKLANLLSPYEIRSDKSKDKRQVRGYFAAAFRPAWGRYCPPLGQPAYSPSPPTLPDGYDAYLKTPHWLAFSQKVRAFWDNRCIACYRVVPLQVHHRTYVRLGKEKITDCYPACADCHPVLDTLRKGAK